MLPGGPEHSTVNGRTSAASRAPRPGAASASRRIGIAIFLVALAIRVGAAWLWHFDGLYGQDAFAHYAQAIAIADSVPRGEAPPLDYLWPNGYAAMVAASFSLLGVRPLAAQVVSMVCGAGVAWLAFLLCRDLFPRSHARAGVVAGLLVAVAGQAVLSSIVVMSDAAALFWATLAAWLMVVTWRHSRTGAWLTAAGAALGLALVTRWLYAAITPALAYYVWRQRARSPRWLPSVLLALAAATLIVLPQVALSLHRPEGLLHQWLIGWRPRNALATSLVSVADGTLTYVLPVGVFYAMPAAHPAYLVPPLGLLALWGAVHAWICGARDALALLLGWAAAVYVFLAGIPYENLRFGLPIWLPLVLLVGVGADRAWSHPRLGRLTRTAVVLSIGFMLIWTCWTVHRFVSRQQALRRVVHQVEQRLSGDATLVTFGVTATARFYTRLDVIELFEQDAGSLDALTSRAARVYLLLDTANAATQWSGRPPDINHRWLREHTRMTRVADFPPYTLFECVR